MDNSEQYRIRQLAENLLNTLDALVPASTDHPAVSDSRRVLKDLIATYDSIPTQEPNTWTFFGHWKGDRLVIDYAEPGVVQDDREDESGQYAEGLWAAAASGATLEEARAAAIAEYEGDEEGR